MPRRTYREERDLVQRSRNARSMPEPTRSVQPSPTRQSPDDPRGVIRFLQRTDDGRRRTDRIKPTLPTLPPFKEID